MRRALFVLAAALSLWLAPGALAAGWCGTGTTTQDLPDIVTGRQVHAIVALPADAPDTFAADANRVADDTASMTSWWLRQDPTRAPRFDLAQFSTGACLDISFIRLPSPGSAYVGSASGAFQRVENDLGAAGFTNPALKYLVYFDGPSVAADVCGTGAGQFLGGSPGYAVVWLAGCPGVPTDSIAAHELLHSLGALPAGAPHACPGDSGHPCDSKTDVLYPKTDGSPLIAQALDFNHDDYYAHNGSWDDLQDSQWLHRVDVPPVPLAVALTGRGSVTSDVPGVDCTAACTTQWDPGSQLILSAEGTAGTRFVRWAGTCSGTSDCLLTLTQPATATAVFGPLRIPLRVTTAGKGSVKCTPKCTKTFTGGDPLILRAVARAGWRFSRWSGGCKGTRPTCRPVTDFAVSVRATFRRR
jgi:hypothetical protein